MTPEPLKTFTVYAQHLEVFEGWANIQATTPEEAVNIAKESNLADFNFDSFHDSEPPFHFRVEDQSGHDLLNESVPEHSLIAQQGLNGAMLSALVLCVDALETLARADDGTCSISALFAARKAIANATGKEG